MHSTSKLCMEYPVGHTTVKFFSRTYGPMTLGPTYGLGHFWMQCHFQILTNCGCQYIAAECFPHHSRKGKVGKPTVYINIFPFQKREMGPSINPHWNNQPVVFSLANPHYTTINLLLFSCNSRWGKRKMTWLIVLILFTSTTTWAPPINCNNHL